MQKPEEIWKVVPDHERYMVSNLGNVKSLDFNGTGEEKQMKLYKNKLGYQKVSFSKESGLSVHRLVCCTFNEVSLDTELYVCHKNDVKDDNRIDNLYLGTPEDNMRDRIRNYKRREAENVVE